MIKAAGKTGLGIPVLMAELGLPQIEVLIHYGRTEETILEELESHGVKIRKDSS